LRIAQYWQFRPARQTATSAAAGSPAGRQLSAAGPSPGLQQTPCTLKTLRNFPDSAYRSACQTENVNSRDENAASQPEANAPEADRDCHPRGKVGVNIAKAGRTEVEAEISVQAVQVRNRSQGQQP
jgi:hypothetical protein